MRQRRKKKPTCIANYYSISYPALFYKGSWTFGWKGSPRWHRRNIKRTLCKADARTWQSVNCTDLGEKVWMVNSTAAPLKVLLFQRQESSFRTNNLSFFSNIKSNDKQLSNQSKFSNNDKNLCSLKKINEDILKAIIRFQWQTSNFCKCPAIISQWLKNSWIEHNICI